MYWPLTPKNASKKLSPTDAEKYRRLVNEQRKKPIRMNRKHFLNNDYNSGASFRGYIKIAEDGEINGLTTITGCHQQIDLDVFATSSKALNRTLKKYKKLIEDLEELVGHLEELRPYVQEMEKLQRKAREED